MKLFSGLIGIIVLVVALCLTLANRESVTLNLWPFGVGLTAPLCVLTLGPLFIGILFGALLAWIIMLPQRFRAHRLGKDVAALHEQLKAMQQRVLAPESRDQLLAIAKTKWAFWKRS